MIPIRIRIKDQQAQKRLKKIETGLPAEMRKELSEVGKAASKEGKQLARRLFKRGSSIPKSFGFSLRKSRQGVARFVARLGFINTRTRRAFLANFYEQGATIRPKKSANLWVPIAGNRGPRGEAVQSAREAIATGNTFLQRGPSGHMVAFMREGPQLQPLFVLKKEVSVRPRPVFGPIWRRYQRRLTDAAENAMRRVNR